MIENDVRVIDIDASSISMSHKGIVEYLLLYDPLKLDEAFENIRIGIWSGSFLSLKNDLVIGINQALISQIMAIIIYVTQLHHYKKLYKDKGIVFKYGEFNYPNMSQYLMQDVLPKSNFVRTLRDGPKPTTLINRLARKARAMQLNSSFHVPLFLSGLRDSEVLVSQRTHSIEKWCVSNQISPSLMEDSWCFGPVDDSTVSVRDKVDTKVLKGQVKNLVELVSASLNKIDVTLFRSDLDWLEDQLSELMAHARYHYFAACTSQFPIPKLFISGRVGSPWDRIMRLLTRSHGGSVIGFEHGCGVAFHGSVFAYMNEWYKCDRYVPMNEDSRDLILNTTEVYGKIVKIPEIEIPPHCNDSKVKDEYRYPVKAKRILFLPMGTAGERGRPFTMYPDILSVDFNCRFISLLQEMGFDVELRPHPSNAGPGRDRYLEAFDVTWSKGDFESALSGVDCLITCDTMSTTIYQALSMKIPVIVLETGVPRLSNAARKSLESVVKVISIRKNIDSKMEIPREILTQLLQVA